MPRIRLILVVPSSSAAICSDGACSCTVMLHRRRFAPVGGEQVGEAAAQHRAGGADVERADQARADRADFFLRRLDLLLDRPGPRQQRRARRRQLDPPAGAIEQAGAERGLQRLDLLAQRRLRQFQPPRRVGEAALLGDRDEITELPEVHIKPLLIVLIYILDSQTDMVNE